MKAIVYKRYGQPDVLRYEEVNVPDPGDGEVLVRIHAASVNSWDWDMLTGSPRIYRLLSGLSKPRYPILGCDIAGVVEAAGSKSSKFKPGVRVFADTSPAGFGAFAEYAAVPERLLARMPEKITFEQAASLPQAGVLALQGLRYKGDLRPGHKVLLNGAGGGVGTLALQLAKGMGAEVTCVDSAGKLDALKELGADHVIDFREADYTRTGIAYDKILDMVAGRSVADYKRALRTGGIFALIGGRPGVILRIAFLGPWTSSGKKLGLMPHRPNRTDLEFLGSQVTAGMLTPVIDSTFTLEETADALRRFGEGQFFGKIVISIRGGR